jgi:hypothetical protein
VAFIRRENSLAGLNQFPDGRVEFFLNGHGELLVDP